MVHHRPDPTTDCPAVRIEDDTLIAFEAAKKRADALFYRLHRVGRAADKLLECLNEFAPEYPQACSDCCEYLDTVLAEAATAGDFDREEQP